MPTGCTSESNCDWICNKMVDGAGIIDLDESMKDIDDSESLNETLRILDRSFYVIVYSAQGYEADSEVN